MQVLISRNLYRRRQQRIALFQMAPGWWHLILGPVTVEVAFKLPEVVAPVVAFTASLAAGAAMAAGLIETPTIHLNWSP